MAVRCQSAKFDRQVGAFLTMSRPNLLSESDPGRKCQLRSSTRGLKKKKLHAPKKPQAFTICRSTSGFRPKCFAIRKQPTTSRTLLTRFLKDPSHSAKFPAPLL
jgi:hypothetical protein